MPGPTFTLENRFLPLRGIAGSSSGNGTVSGYVKSRSDIAGQSGGSSSISGLMKEFTRIASVSLGIGSVSAALESLIPTVYHVIIAGQSNATGGGSPIEYTAPDASALMFNGGLRPGALNAALTSFVPMQEDAGPEGETTGMNGQSVASTLARELLESTPPGSKLLVSCMARSGLKLSAIKKGTTHYASGLAHVTKAKAISDGLGYGYRVLGVVFIHGETDEQHGTTTYGAEVLEYANDLHADYSAISGQAQRVALFACQNASGYDKTVNGSVCTPTILLTTAVDNPTKIALVSPRYMLEHPDTLHMATYGNLWQGRRYGAALGHWVAMGALPDCLRPTSVAMEAGNTQVLVSFTVPSGQLVIDREEVVARKDGGFYFWDDSGSPPTVSSFELVGATQVRLYLSAASTGASRRLLYGRKDADPNGRPTNFARMTGNIRDNAAGTSAEGFPAHNWCQQFNLQF